MEGPSSVVSKRAKKPSLSDLSKLYKATLTNWQVADCSLDSADCLQAFWSVVTGCSNKYLVPVHDWQHSQSSLQSRQGVADSWGVVVQSMVEVDNLGYCYPCGKIPTREDAHAGRTRPLNYGSSSVHVSLSFQSV